MTNQVSSVLISLIAHQSWTSSTSTSEQTLINITSHYQPPSSVTNHYQTLSLSIFINHYINKPSKATTIALVIINQKHSSTILRNHHRPSSKHQPSTTTPSPPCRSVNQHLGLRRQTILGQPRIWSAMVVGCNDAHLVTVEGWWQWLIKDSSLCLLMVNERYKWLIVFLVGELNESSQCFWCLRMADGGQLRYYPGVG